MGIVYYLARPDNGSLFTLGKWWREPDVFFGDSFDEGKHVNWPMPMLDEAQMRAGIRAKIGEEPNPPVHGWDAYADELVRRILVFAAGQLVIYTSDSYDLSSDPPYVDDDDERRVIDTAYSSDWEGWRS